MFYVQIQIPKLCSCLRDSNRGLFKHFFGEDGKKRMQLSSFDDFLKGLHDEIVRLEFSHYDFKNQVRSLPKVLLLRMRLAKCVFLHCTHVWQLLQYFCSDQVRSLWRHLAILLLIFPSCAWGLSYELSVLQAMCSACSASKLVDSSFSGFLLEKL